MSDSDSNPPIACTLTTDRETQRSERVRSVLAADYERAIERDDGYTLLFDGAGETLSAVATFVANEHQCCSFAEYSIDVSPPYGETRLTITGPDGTTAVFADLLELLEKDAA